MTNMHLSEEDPRISMLWCI